MEVVEQQLEVVVVVVRVAVAELVVVAETPHVQIFEVQHFLPWRLAVLLDAAELLQSPVCHAEPAHCFVPASVTKQFVQKIELMFSGMHIINGWRGEYFNILQKEICFIDG